jgi:hypothetical protein
MDLLPAPWSGVASAPSAASAGAQLYRSPRRRVNPPIVSVSHAPASDADQLPSIPLPLIFSAAVA